MKKLYLLIFAAVLAVNISAQDLGGSPKTRHQMAEFVEPAQHPNIDYSARKSLRRVKSKIQMPDPINVQEIQGVYIFHFLGYVGGDIEPTHYSCGEMNIIATGDNTVKIGPFYWNVYFDGVFDAATHTITISKDQAQPILNQTSVKLNLFATDINTMERDDVLLQIDAANHMIYWESSTQIAEIAQVGSDVPALSAMGLYIDYANTYMMSYDIEGSRLVGPYRSWLWVEPVDGQRDQISVSNFCDLSTLYPMTLTVNNDNRTATATNAQGFFRGNDLYLWSLDENDAPVSRTLTFDAGIYNVPGDDEANERNLMALTIPAAGAMLHDKSDGLLYADIQIIMPFDPFSTGVNDIEADDNAPVEYFNLQGVRVDNPGHGLYIMRKGNSTSKVIL